MDAPGYDDRQSKPFYKMAALRKFWRVDPLLFSQNSRSAINAVFGQSVSKNDRASAVN